MKDLVSMLAASIRDHGPRPLFGTRTAGAWSWMSYEEFGRRVDALRAGLASLGVGPGSRVAVVSRNRVEWAVGCYATAGLGAVYVPMYEAQLERDWLHILADSEASVCLVAGSVALRFAAVAASVPALRHVVGLDEATDAPGSYLGLARHGERHPVAAVTPAPGDLAELIYTSGTTGRPKGVRLTHANVVSNVSAVAEIVPFSNEDRSLSFLPWAHVFGGAELHGIILLGASTAICEAVEHLVEELPEVRPTLLFAVPRVWNKVYQGVRQKLQEEPRLFRTVFEHAVRARHRLRRGEPIAAGDAVALAIARRTIFSKIRERFGGRLRLAVSGAAALAPEVAEFIDDLGVVVLEAYGLTESSCCATANRPDDRRIGSVGKAIPGVRVELDTSVQGAEAGEGEVVVYGHCVMAGYNNLPDETARVLTPDGGLRTGDLGRFDRDGFLHITGRIKDLYKLENGKYVAPAALEETLTLSPLIEQAFVHGPDRPYCVALLVPDRAALLSWARERGREVQDYAALLEDPEVRAVFLDEIAHASTDFKGYERIEAFALLEEPFSTSNGLLTPTLKVKRRKVLERHAERIEALYAAARPDASRAARAAPSSVHA